MKDANPIPASVGGPFSSQLSASANPSKLTQGCGDQAQMSVVDAVPCDLNTLQLQVSTGGDSGSKPSTMLIPLDSSGKPRKATLDVICGLRPMNNAGAGQQVGDKSKMHLVRNPAQVLVTANYAAQCGQHGHPGIRVQPEDDDEVICQAKLFSGTTAKFEAFRKPNRVEVSRKVIDGGPIFAVIRLLASFIEDDGPCGSVLVAASSCGIRGSGPCIGQLTGTVMLYSEDVVELSLVMPPLLGVSRKKEGVDRYSGGELLVDGDGKLGAAKNGFTHQVDTRYQGLLGYREESASTATFEGNTSQSSTVTDAGWNSLDASAYGYVQGGAWSFIKKDDHSGVGNYLIQRGFDLSLRHNGESVGIEGIKSFLESCEKIEKTIAHFRAIWEAGTGVKCAVGWSASWKLEFMRLSCAAKWSRTIPAGASRMLREREGTVTLTPVAGSATAAFGVVVLVERLGMEVLSMDMSVSLTLSGSVKGSLTWKAQRAGDADWSQAAKRTLVTGEVGLAFNPTAKVAALGRTIGCQLKLASGLVVEGVLDSAHGGFDEAKVDLLPVVFTVLVYIGSTGEVDYTYEQEVFAGQPLYQFQGAAHV